MSETGLRHSIESFLHLASQFCDEKSEGRLLRYGLVHGNPALLFHWDGPSPLPLASTDIFFSPRKLPKQFHLTDDPEDRCTVIPWLPPESDTALPLVNQKEAEPLPRKVRADCPIPAFALELRHFKQAFAEYDGSTNSLQFWSEEFRPYIYFTSRFRWAVGCVVGPYSEMRIFTGGALTAFRDGKGWKVLRRLENKDKPAPQPWQVIEKACPQWSGKQILRHLIEIAVQLSPIANRQSKGGMILYAPECRASGTNGQLWGGPDEPLLQRLRAEEPTELKHEQNQAWLTGRAVLSPREPDSAELVLDVEIATRLIRACSQDGAVIVRGEPGVIHTFAKRITPPPFDKGQKQRPPVGTKSYTAESFVHWVANQKSGVPLAKRTQGFAISISADGEIKIFAAQGWDEKGKVKIFNLVLFNSYDDTH